MKHICILLSIVLLGYCSLITADLINPNAASISYRGRFDLSNINKAAWFEWSGVSIDLHLTTSDVSTIGIYLTEKGNQGNRYNIWDLNRNAVVMVLNTSTGSQLYSLGGSAQSAFTYPIAIRVEKRTEAFWGAAAFLGFDVATNNNQPLNPQDIAPRSAQKIRGAPRPNRIEFIGDSLTCAYGNEGQAPCSFSQATQNAHLSFATVTAMALNADYHIQCWSGKGIVRNAGSKNSTSPDPIGYYYPRTLPTESDSVWNPSDWELIDSDAIVITLGGNDFSAPQSAWPTYEQIFDGYQTLVDYVQSTYNSTGVPPIVFLAVGPLPNDPDVYVGRVVEDLNALGNDRVYFINMKGTLTDPSHDVGCDGHPSVSGDAKMAAKMTKIMQSVLNWQ